MKTDICIVGGGSAGFGAAMAAVRGGCDDVILIERGDSLGGTATLGGVCCWEPGIGGPGIHRELYERLRSMPAAVGVGSTAKKYSAEEPWGFSSFDPQSRYEHTLRRAGLAPEQWRRVPFEPQAMQRVMLDMVHETAAVRVLLGFTCMSAETENGRVRRIVAADPQGTVLRLEARQFVDCTADIAVARMAGCGSACGEDARASYNEPSAPEEASPTVNGASLLFRVSPRGGKGYDEPPPWIHRTDALEWATSRPRAASINELPGGDLSINILPVMDGSEYLSLPIHESLILCRARVYAYWRMLQEREFFRGHRLASLAPRVGVRESYRLRGRYVLNEHDVRAGIDRQPHADTLVTFADHALDTHGRTHTSIPGAAELRGPYGVPLDCLLPREITNLIVACRGSSFTHIAASSCRLSRTMMALGEAAGTAAAIAVQRNLEVSEVDAAWVRNRLGLDRFQDRIKL